jgi:FkbM family methyltransferase
VSEKYFTQIIEAWPKLSHGTAFDIGANHGIYTNLLATRFARVFAFEPDLTNLETIAAVAASNVICVHRAISDVNGPIKLWTCGSNTGGHTINPNVCNKKVYDHDPGRFVEVTGVTIDEYCKLLNIQDLRVIKMDIEGAEDFVWNGAIETLRNNQLGILLEVHKEVNTDKLGKFFADLGYNIYEDDKKVAGFTHDSHFLVTNID